MHALVQIIAFHSTDTIPVEVYVHIANGLPTIVIADLNSDATISQSTIA